MLDTTTQGDAAPPDDERQAAPARERRPADVPRPATAPEAERAAPADEAERQADEAERQGCLFALSQPPLMIFLAVISILILAASLHDLLLL
ncbi:hypothetical protein AB0B50_08995 [Streptomyces sp. NPDC041068]|uniref:hypothetical protein n=1 Tax=Streptomyces sp. NPDC041068 TaxID=3155130 RepID=UPI0033E0E840